jgi:hypothetical protein
VLGRGRKTLFGIFRLRIPTFDELFPDCKKPILMLGPFPLDFMPIPVTQNILSRAFSP